MLRASPAAYPVNLLRSPLPLLAGGIAVALLIILLVTLPVRPTGPDLSRRETLNQREAVVIVAERMRSGEAATRVATEGTARFVEEEGWYVTAGDALFRFNERTRIVVPENDAARALQFRDAAR